MSSRAADLLHTCLLVLCTFRFGCVLGRGGGSSRSCNVALLVEQDKSLVAALGRRTTLECYVDHCGEPVRVSWCKERVKCEDIFPNDSVEITQTAIRKRHLVSSLTFKRISYMDAGLYRCYVNGEQAKESSHGMIVKVSPSNPTCEVALFVKRGTSVAAAPGQTLTLQCPVEPCGKAVKVTWCRGRDQCVDIIQTSDLEITQTSRNHLLSSLTFNRIALDDGGLYKCRVNDNQNEVISHGISVNVSVLNRGVRYSGDNFENSQRFPNSGEGHDTVTDNGISWLPFLLIGIGVAALVCIVIGLPVIKGYCQKRRRTFNPVQRQEMSTHMIPGLPPRSAPPTFVQQNQPIFLSPPASQLPVNANAHQPEGVVYSGINHRLEAPSGGYFY